MPTVEDILAELAKPGRDPRSEFKVANFAEGVNDLEDLKDAITEIQNLNPRLSMESVSPHEYINEEVVILREIRFSDLPRVIRESMVLVGGILIILGVSMASTNYMIAAGIPQQLLEFVAGFVSSQVTFLILLLVFLLILGAILDIFSAIVLVVPLILPIAAGYHVNEVHLGIVFLAAMQLGYMTPPVGLNLFIASYRFEKPIMHVYSATFPFLVILMMSVLVITFWPDLSLWLVPD